MAATSGTTGTSEKTVAKEMSQTAPDQTKGEEGRVTVRIAERLERQLGDDVRARMTRGNWRHTVRRTGVLQRVLDHFGWDARYLPCLERATVALAARLASDSGDSRRAGWRVSAVLVDGDSDPEGWASAWGAATATGAACGQEWRVGLSPIESQIARDCMIARGNFDLRGVQESIYFCPASLFRRLDAHRDIDDWERALELPELSGTAKQVDWARANRAQLLPGVLGYAVGASDGVGDRASGELGDDDKTVLNDAKEWVRGQLSAGYWISAKRVTSMILLSKAVEWAYRQAAVEMVKRLGL